jgi:hypothetical protein
MQRNKRKITFPCLILFLLETKKLLGQQNQNEMMEIGDVAQPRPGGNGLDFSVDKVLYPALFYTHTADHLWSAKDPSPSQDALANGLNSLRTRLHYAVEIQDVEMVKQTLRDEPDLLTASFKWRGTPLHVVRSPPPLFPPLQHRFVCAHARG